MVPSPPPTCYPSQEICNGLDDDCDGLIDEKLLVDCSNACGQGWITCTNAQTTACSAPKPVYEICNGLDDDCDGLIDEAEDLEIKPCYPGNPSDLLHGECHFGVTRCSDGRESCVGYAAPRVEACNGLDDDCDGIIDEDVSDDMDLVVAVDYSGSMQRVIPEIAAAVADWSSKYSGGTLRVSLVGVPADYSSADFKVTLMMNFASPAEFSVEIAKHKNPGGAASEATIDAIWMVARLDNPLGLSWRGSAARVMVLFTDEEPQSYQVPIVTEQDAMSEVLNSGLKVTVLTAESSWYNWNAVPVVPVSIGKKLDEIVYAGSCKQP